MLAKNQDVRHGTYFGKSIHSLAIKILKKYNRPMSVSEITEKIQEYRKLNGSTPNNSVSAALQRSKYVVRSKYSGKRGYYRLSNMY